MQIIVSKVDICLVSVLLVVGIAGLLLCFFYDVSILTSAALHNIQTNKKMKITAYVKRLTFQQG